MSHPSAPPPRHPIYGKWWIKLLAGLAMAVSMVACLIPAGWQNISGSRSLLGRIADLIGPWPSAALFGLFAAGLLLAGYRQLRTENLTTGEPIDV